MTSFRTLFDEWLNVTLNTFVSPVSVNVHMMITIIKCIYSDLQHGFFEINLFIADVCAFGVSEVAIAHSFYTISIHI